MSSDVKEWYLKARYIVVFRNGVHEVLEGGYLGVRGDKIIGFGKTLPTPSVDVEDLGDRLIIPGFVNVHCHPAWSAVQKSLLEDTGSRYFYHDILFEHLFGWDQSAEDCEAIARTTLTALLLSGCTTVVDPGSQISAQVADAIGEMGMRGYVGAPYRAGIWHTEDGHSLVHPLDEQRGLQKLGEAIQFVERYDGTYGGRVRALLGPTQTTTCTPRLLAETRQAADRIGVGVTIHAAESFVEFQDCVRRYGRTPFEMLADAGLLGSDVLIGHGIFPSGHSRVNYPGDGDLRLLAETKTPVAHCPFGFMMRGYAMESYPRYLQMGIPVGIGTDSPNADYLQEMRWACGVGKLVERSCFEPSAADAFNSATLGGAQALRRSDIGRLAPGAQADLVALRLDSHEMTPVRDPIKNLVYSGTRHSVDRVYVQGRCLVKDGKALDVDEGALLRRVQDIAVAAWSQTSEQDWDKRTVDQLSPLSFARCEHQDWSASEIATE